MPHLVPFRLPRSACHLFGWLGCCAFVVVAQAVPVQGQTISRATLALGVEPRPEPSSDETLPVERTICIHSMLLWKGITGRSLQCERISCGHPPFTFASEDVLLIEPFKILPRTDQKPEVFGPLPAIGVETSSVPPLSGEHVITASGNIQLGKFGEVHVAGLSIDQAQQSIHARLSLFFIDPQIKVDVKTPKHHYYIITSGAGFSEPHVRSKPLWGHVTVLDALSTYGAQAPLSSAKISINRPPLDYKGPSQNLLINWDELKAGKAENHQLLPGDRLYIEGQPSLWTNMATKVTRPLRQTLGFVTQAPSWLTQ